MSARTPVHHSARLSLSGMNERLRAFEARLETIEHNQGEAGDTITALSLADKALEKSDGALVASVDELTKAIKDPETGLIVGLREFRTEVRNDRKVTRAYIAGACAVLTLIWTILIAFAPSIRATFGIPQ